MSGNTVTAKYIADTSQMEIANDKLTAQNEKLARQVSILTSKASGFNKTYGNSWNAVRARVEQYTKAVKDATNLRDWYAAVEKLQEASAQFKVIEGNLKGVVAGESAAVVQVVRLENSYTALKEAIDRTKKARDGSIAGSSEYNVLTDKLMKLEQAYDRVAAANKRAAGGQGAKMSADAAKQALYKHRPSDVIQKDLNKAERDLFKDQHLYNDANFEQQAALIQRYRKELELARQAEAAFKKASSGGGKTFRKVSANSEEGLQNQIGFLEKKRSAMGPGAEFDKLNGIIAKLQVRLKAVRGDAKKAGEALSEAATAPIGSFKRVEYELKKAKDQLELLTYGTKEYIQQSKKVDEIAAAYRKLDKDINKVVKAQKESGGLMGTISGQAKTLVMTYVGMHEVVSQITQEWEKQRQIQLDIANRSLTFDQEIVRQSANIGSKDIDAVKKWAIGNQGDLLMGKKDIVRLVGTAKSGGAENTQEAMQVVRAAAKVALGNSEVAEQMLQGGLILARLNNSKNFEAAFGQLRSASQVSQSVDESEFISNAMPRVAAMMQDRINTKGMSSKDAVAWAAVASRLLPKQTAEESSTLMANVVQKMDQWTPEREKKLKDKTVSKVDQATIDAFKAAKTFEGRLEVVRSSEEMMKQWINAQKGGNPQDLGLMLIRNSDATSKIIAEAKNAIPEFKDGAEIFKQAAMDIRAAVPNLVADLTASAKSEQATSGDMVTAEANARKQWDAIWNGGTDVNGNKVSPVNLTGWDAGVRMQMWDDRRAQRWARGVGRGDASGNDVTDMIDSLRPLIKFEAEAGNKTAAGQLQAQLEALNIIAEEIQRLNRNVENRPAAPPVNRAPALPRPAARAPAVN